MPIPDQIAAVILEAGHGDRRTGTWISSKACGQLTDQHGAVLIFDEMITGMRWSRHGAQSVYGVTPDLSTWGKAIGNGFAVSALAGKRELMEPGGLNTDASRVFLLSTTHGAETTGLAAYLAVSAGVRRTGRGRRDGGSGHQAALRAGAGRQGGGHVRARDHSSDGPSCLVFATKDHKGQPSQAFRTLFIQELLRRGVLGQSLVISAAHTDADIDQTVDAAAGALEVYARAVEAGSTDGLLVGRPVAPAMREFAEPRRLQAGRHHERGGAA